MNRTVDENPLRAPVQQMRPPTAQPKFGRIDAGLDQVDEAVEASKQHIFEMQHEDGHWVGELEADGMLATCLQHEMDHLEGVLFIDHLSKLKRSMVLKKLQKAKRLQEAG